jgi:hypothetical protein
MRKVPLVMMNGIISEISLVLPGILKVLRILEVVVITLLYIVLRE